MSRIFPVAVSLIAFGALAACSDTMSSPSAYSSAHQVAQSDVPTICAAIDNASDRQVCVNNQPPMGPAWGAD